MRQAGQVLDKYHPAAERRSWHFSRK